MDFLASSRRDSMGQTSTAKQTVTDQPPYQLLHQKYTALQGQHEKLKQHLAAMSETVRVLGDQSCHTTKMAQQAQDSKLDILSKHTKLQEQCKGLKDTVEVLNRNFEAANEKLFLQNQLHENKLRTMEAAHNTLKERCKAMATSTEQHRLSHLKMELQNKSMTNDIERLTELHASAVQAKDSEVHSLQSKLSKLESDFTKLKTTHETKIESHSIEAKRLRAKIQATESLLKAHPIDSSQNTKTKNILSSSAEILELAHANGSVDSMKQCLSEVAGVLRDLNGQLGTQYKLSKAWLERVSSL